MDAEAKPTSLVAVMFTDLVDSTSIGQRLDADDQREAKEEFFRVHQHLVNDAVTSESALVRTWHGDGARFVFPAIGYALAAACKVQQTMEAYNAHPLRIAGMAVRVGIAVGDDELEPPGLGGVPTIQAARLCNQATGGQVLCTELVALLAAGSISYKFEALGPVHLKGFDQSVNVSELLWRTSKTTVPDTFPRRLVDTSAFGFAGRLANLEELRLSWADASGGRSNLVLVGGEPGVGKTRIAAQSAADSHELGSDVLYGRSDPNHSQPYQPFADALRAYFEAHHALTGEESVDTQLGRLLSTAERKRAGLPDPVSMASSDEAIKLFGAVIRWLRIASSDRTLVIVLDDLGWADKGSLDLLAYILENAHGMRLQLIATYRDDPVDQSEWLTDTLGRCDRTNRTRHIHLTGLKTIEVEEMMQRGSAPELANAGTEFAGHLVRLTGGNPFYVTDTVAWLDQQGKLAEAVGGDWPLMGGQGVELPEKVAHIAEQRLLHVKPEGRDLVRAAALMGSKFETAVLVMVAGVDESEVIETLDQAAKAGIVSDDPGSGRPAFLFSHDLLRESLVQGLSASKAALLHRRIGSAIRDAWPSELGANAAEIAQHFSMSHNPEAEAEAIELFSMGAERALRKAAPSTAAELLGSALDMAERTGANKTKMVELRFRLGIAQKRNGSSQSRRTLLDAGDHAFELGEREVAMSAALANSRGLFSLVGRVDSEVVDQLTRALELVEPGEDVERAGLLAGLSQELTFDDDRHRADRMSQEALALARQTGDVKTLIRALNARHSVLWHPDGLAERVRIVDEWEKAAQELDDPGWAASAASFGFQTAVESGAIGVAERRLGELREFDRALHQPQLSAYSMLWRGVLATLRGDLPEAERLAEEARNLNASTGNSEGAAWWLGQMYPVRWHQGRLGELEPDFAAGFEFFPALPVLGAALATISAELNNRDRCREVLTQVPMEQLTAGRAHIDQLVTVALLAKVASFLDDRDLAKQLHPLLTPYVDQYISNGSVHLGSAHHYLALVYSVLGEPELADLEFARAERANRNLGAPPLVARTQESWAAALKGGNEEDRRRARGLADVAIATASELGLDGIARDAQRTVSELT